MGKVKPAVRAAELRAARGRALLAQKRGRMSVVGGEKAKPPRKRVDSKLLCREFKTNEIRPNWIKSDGAQRIKNFFERISTRKGCFRRHASLQSGRVFLRVGRPTVAHDAPLDRAPVFTDVFVQSGGQWCTVGTLLQRCLVDCVRARNTREARDLAGCLALAITSAPPDAVSSLRRSIDYRLFSVGVALAQLLKHALLLFSQKLLLSGVDPDSQLEIVERLAYLEQIALAFRPFAEQPEENAAGEPLYAKLGDPCTLRAVLEPLLIELFVRACALPHVPFDLIGAALETAPRERLLGVSSLPEQISAGDSSNDEARSCPIFPLRAVSRDGLRRAIRSARALDGRLSDLFADAAGEDERSEGGRRRGKTASDVAGDAIRLLEVRLEAVRAHVRAARAGSPPLLRNPLHLWVELFRSDASRNTVPGGGTHAVLSPWHLLACEVSAALDADSNIEPAGLQPDERELRAVTPRERGEFTLPATAIADRRLAAGPMGRFQGPSVEPPPNSFRAEIAARGLPEDDFEELGVAVRLEGGRGELVRLRPGLVSKLRREVRC